MSLGIPFGKYRLTRRLARGGMAEVFLATQKGPEGFERQVALKRILPHLADIPQFAEMFLDEARLAAQISHPNIAHIYEFGEQQGTYFIAMEYINGVDLSVVVLDGPRRPLPLEHGARIIADVCAALHYAHNLKSAAGTSLGLVHRDISPQNILVSFDGAVKMLDFGIAKAVHHAERTQPGIVRGKYSYMSPEQVEGKKLDRRSDLFSAGIVLHELCTGSTLFPRNDAVKAMYAIRNNEIPRPRRDGRELPQKLQQILDRSLTRHKEDRYEHAAQMQMDLEEYLRSADQICNSIVLADYFKEHYQPQGAQHGDGLAAAAAVGGTARVGDPKLLLGTARVGARNESDGSTQVLSAEDLEPLTSGIDRPREISGIIELTPAESRQEPAEREQTAQILGSDTVESLTTGSSEGDPTVPQSLYRELGESPVKKPATDGGDEFPAAQTRLQAASRRRGRSRLLLVILALGVVLTGVLVGYLLSVPRGPKPTLAPRASHAVSPDRGPAALASSPDQATAIRSKLRILSTPTGASIKVDGSTLPGITPMDRELQPGTHTILASYPGYEDRAQVVQLEPGELLRVSLVLRHKGGDEVVSLRRPDPPPKNNPGSTRRQPRQKPRPRPAEPVVIDPEKQSATRRPDARPPAPRAPQYGLLSITTIPWTRVYLGSRELGITPLARLRLPAGTHSLRFVNPRGISVRRAVVVRAGRVNKVKLRFQ